MLPGEPRQKIEAAAPVSQVAVLGADYAQAKPEIAVAEGDFVKLGQTLFTDRRDRAVRFTAPAAGRVLTVQRGRRRRLLEIGIQVDAAEAQSSQYLSCTPQALAALEPTTVRERLLDSGLWPAFRARPFDAVPLSVTEPRAILVTAMDSNPLAADPAVVLAERSQSFAAGLTVLARLSDRVVLCTRPGVVGSNRMPRDIELAEFSGPHPAGLAGTHLHVVETSALPGEIWHIGYQDVIAIGTLFLSGTIATERIVAIGGPGALRPRLVRTRLGASLRELLRDEIARDGIVIAGSVLAGRRIDPSTSYLGRYDTQISVLRGSADSDDPWAAELHGQPSGMLSVESFERIWPFAMPPLPLLRALLSHDVELTRRLGGLKFAAEDLALCSFVCPAKQDYGAALDATLARYREEL